MAIPTYSITIVADSIEQIHDRMRDMLPGVDEIDTVPEMDLEGLLLYTDGRCQAAGYEMVVNRKPELGTSVAPKKVETKSTLKTDLEASIQEIEKKAKGGNGHSAPETDDQRKTRCVDRLQKLFAEGRKTEVRALLKQYGDGAKNFHGVSVERFADIDQALKDLKL